MFLPLILTVFLFAAAPATGETRVVASIRPIHSLVSAVLGDQGDVHLIVQGAGSPHTYALRPSDADALQNADVVFWIGEEFEIFLEGPLDALANDTRIVALGNAEGISLRSYEAEPVGPEDEHHDEAHEHEHGDEAHEDEHHDEAHEHEHGDEAHEDEHHDEAHEHEHGDEAHEDEHHDEAHEHEHGDEAHEDEHHDEAHEHEHGDEAHEGEHHDEAHDTDHGHDGHAHGEFDQHVWLDTDNAIAMVEAIVQALAAADPENETLYRANGNETSARLSALRDELAAELADVQTVPFLVFHDAYGYFVSRFDLNMVGFVTATPHQQTGAQRVRELQEAVRQTGAVCAFAEPQFQSAILDVVIEGTEMRLGTLDPLGSAIETGPDQYFQMMREIAGSLTTCLSPQ